MAAAVRQLGWRGMALRNHQTGVPAGGRPGVPQRIPGRAGDVQTDLFENRINTGVEHDADDISPDRTR